ncbi:hypothetical protein RHPLAN_45500 [Rhodoplanes sp. Z2-YC6860]|nr:hypothetical protein RHPLAN_45500 [Rhodoplanes sp. Z2-YC6860]
MVRRVESPAPPSVEQPAKPLLIAPARHALAIVALIGGAWLGLYGGNWLIYAIARWTDRDITELKVMLMWGTLASALIGAVLGVWLVLICTRCSREARRVGLIATGVTVMVGALVMLGSFDWRKSSGVPEVMYEIRLPAGAPQPRFDRVSIILWSDRAGQGCYIAEVRRDGEQPVISGTFRVNGSGERTLSLGLDREPQGYWTMPIKSDAKLDRDFGPWQRIAFTPIPRENGSPLPAGDYEVRYRVRKYL